MKRRLGKYLGRALPLLLLGAPAFASSARSISRIRSRAVAVHGEAIAESAAAESTATAVDPFAAFGAGSTPVAVVRDGAGSEVMEFLTRNNLLRAAGETVSNVSGDLDEAIGRKDFAHASAYNHCYISAYWIYNTHDNPSFTPTKCASWAGTWETGTTAPLFQNTSVTNRTATSFNLHVDMSKSCTVYAVLVPAAATAPTSAQVKAGKDGGNNPAVQTKTLASSSLDGSFAGIIAFSGLSAGTSYRVYVTGESGTDLTPTPAAIDPTFAYGTMFTGTYYVWPKLAASPNGNIYLLYLADSTARYSISKWNETTATWGSYAEVSTAGVSTATSNSITVGYGSEEKVDFTASSSGATDYLHTVFGGNQDPYYGLYNGTSWNFTRMYDDVAAPDGIDVFANSSGKAFVSYRTSDANGYYVRYDSNATGSFPASTPVLTNSASSNLDLGKTFIVSDSTGTTRIVFSSEQDPYSHNGYYTASSTDGFATKTMLLNSCTVDSCPSDPGHTNRIWWDVGNVVIDGSNNIYMVYTSMDYVTNTHNAYYRTYQSGSWTAPLELTSAGRSNLSALDIKVVDTTVYIMMRSGSDSSPDYFLKALDGATWYDGKLFKLDGWSSQFTIDPKNKRVMIATEGANYKVNYKTGPVADFVTIAPPNSAPTMAANAGLTVNQTGGETAITNVMLKAADAEQAATALTFTVGTAPAKGTLKKSGVPLSASSTFTQDDIDNSRVTYTPSGSQTGADSFTFTVGDGAGGSIGTTTFTIAITDNVAPTVSSVGVPSGGTYVAGQDLTFTVNFNENITVTGAGSTLGLTIGGALRTAAYQGNTATSVTYRYRVQTGDLDTDGIAVGAIFLNGSTIRDGAGNNATLTLNAVGGTGAVLVDAVSPTAALTYSPAGPYRKGDTITIIADFSEAVADSPTMQIAIGAITGGSSVAAVNMTKVSPSQYKYTHNVGSGNGMATVTLSAGKDLAGNVVTAAPTAGGSFTVARTATTVSVDSSNPSSAYGDTVTFTATVTSGATGTIDFSDGGTPVAGCSGVVLSGSTATCTTAAMAAGNRSIAASYGGDSTYDTSASTPFAQTVAKATLTVTAESKSKNYGTADPALTYSYSGLQGSDTDTVFSGALARVPGENHGSYEITQGTFGAGDNYAISFTGATFHVVTAGANAIVVDPDDPQHLVAGLFGAGIRYSTDGGATWTGAAEQPANQGIKGLVMHPINHATLFAATYGDGIYTSANSGANWSRCSGQPGNLNAVSLAIDSDGKLYAGTEGGIYTSADCSSWNAVSTGLDIDSVKSPVTIAIDPAVPAKLYVGLTGTGIFRSADSGSSWSGADKQPTDQRVKAIVIKPGDGTKLFAATYGGGVFASADGGVTWDLCATQPTSPKVATLTIDGSGKLYAGTDDGVFLSNDGCATWTGINSTLP